MLTEISLDRDTTYQQASTYLASIDADWQQLITQVGVCKLEPRPVQQPFNALIRNVAYQQLHGKAAAAIFQRFLELYDGEFPTAAQILHTDPLLIRACGFSARKLEYILGLANAQQQGIIPDLATAQEMSNEEIIAQLIALKGIGRWTVEMFLMFNLGRLNVWPVDDFAVQQGYKYLKKLEQVPGKKQFREIGEQLAPYQSIAAWYMWRLMDEVKAGRW